MPSGQHGSRPEPPRQEGSIVLPAYVAIGDDDGKP